nr:PREDICTED: zinc finger protein 260-like [Bemisia tabaci]
MILTMNEFLDTDSVFTLPTSNQFLVVQNVSKKLDVDSTVPVLLLDDNQSGYVNNFFCSNNFQEDVDALFASDDLGSELLSFDKDKSFSSLINADDDLGEIIQGPKEDSNHSDVEVDVEGISDDEDDAVSAPKCEKTVYLCSQCSTPFGSIEECKEHMIKDHKFDLLINSVPDEDTSQINSSELETTPSLTQDSEELNEAPGVPMANGNPTENDRISLDSSGRQESEKQDSCTHTPNDETESQPQALANDASLQSTEESIEPEPEAEPTGSGPEVEFFKDPDYVSKSFRCDFLGCCVRFTSHKGCVMHQDCHEVNSKMYVCSQENCDEKFSNWKRCSLHLWKAHQIDIDLYTCPVCSEYKTWSRYSLRTHVKIHLADKGYPCDKCEKKFKQKSQLVNHLAGVHSKKSSKENSSTDDANKWYTKKVCKICSKTYADSKCLKKHIQAVHRKMKPYVCNICGHQSAKKAMMQIHIRSHTGEKPYACTVEGCSYRTGDHNSLRRHLMGHTGNKPYRCLYCPFACIQTINLKRHIAAKHSQAQDCVSFCTLCPFSTVNPNLFKSHMNDHSKGLIEGNSQTVTLEASPIRTMPTDDEDTTNCFPSDEGIVTGGITIPADPNQGPIVLLPPNCNSEFETDALIDAMNT